MLEIHLQARADFVVKGVFLHSCTSSTPLITDHLQEKFSMVYIQYKSNKNKLKIINKIIQRYLE